jgi:periplasmic glucans biosynthesis protein
MNRRTLLGSLLALAASPAVSVLPARAENAFAAAEPFSFEALKVRAELLAKRPFAERPLVAPDVVGRIFYDDHGAIRPMPERALFRGTPFEVTPFHLGQFFPRPVRLHAVAGGQARELIYDRAMFRMPENSPARRMPDDAGYAGFRVHEAARGAQGGDWLAFLGASYFRASGDLSQYGISARGIAVDSGGPGPEEFPDFTEFWIEEAREGRGPTIHALLDGPSVAGAFRFETRRAPETLTDVEAALFFRRDVARLGLAPLTSMFWYGEGEREATYDWRPEVHDSDGLQIETGRGEHLWRPLDNPRHLALSAFSDENPKGFGLMQRDRNGDHYLSQVFFERRPSLWVEPRGDWGRGSVQLLEIPTGGEFTDNVVAFWTPERAPRAGERLDVSYRLRWCADWFAGGGLARATASRLDMPKRDGGRLHRIFYVYFDGAGLAAPGPVEAAASAVGGEIAGLSVQVPPQGPATARRVTFNVIADGARTEPVELALHLTRAGARASETWLYRLEAPEEGVFEPASN